MTFIFNQGRLGFSESWYCTRDDLATALTDAVFVANFRKGLLGRGCFIEAIRVSDEAVLNDSLVQIIQLQPPNNAPNALFAGDPWDSIFARVQAGALYRRQLWMRGVPDVWIELNPADGRPTWIPAFVTAFDNFKDAIVAKRYCIKALQKGGAPAQPRSISAVATSATGNFQITAPGHGLSNLQSVRIKGVKGNGLSNLTGVFVIENVTPNTFEVPLQPLAPGYLYKGNGKVIPRIMGYFPITDAVYLRTAKKSTGRAFFVPRGRRRARR